MQGDFSREDIVNMSIANFILSAQIWMALIILQSLFCSMLPKDVRQHKVFSGPFILVGLAIFSAGIFPAGMVLITDEPLRYGMSGLLLLMLAPFCALTYPTMLANAWLRSLATPETLQRIGLQLAFAIGLFTVGPISLVGFIDLFGILKERLF